jgi:hypothetical protein
MAGKQGEREKIKALVETDDLDEFDGRPQRQRVAPGEAAEYDEWRRERRPRP